MGIRVPATLELGKERAHGREPEHQGLVGRSEMSKRLVRLAWLAATLLALAVGPAAGVRPL